MNPSSFVASDLPLSSSAFSGEAGGENNPRLSRGEPTEKLGMNRITRAVAMKSDGLTKSTSSTESGTNICYAGLQSNPSRSKPIFSLASHIPVSQLQNSPNTKENRAAFEPSSTRSLQPLPSFRALEDSIRRLYPNLTRKSQHTDGTGNASPDPSALKTRRVGISEDLSKRNASVESIGYKIVEARDSEVNQVIEKHAVQSEKHEQLFADAQHAVPRLAETSFNKMSVPNIMNPIMETASVARFRDAALTAQQIGSSALFTQPAVSQIGNNVIHFTRFRENPQAPQLSHEYRSHFSRADCPQSYAGSYHSDLRNARTPTQEHHPVSSIPAPYSEGARYENLGGSLQNRFCYQAHQAVPQQEFRTPVPPSVQTPPSTRLVVDSVAQSSEEVIEADHIRFYDLAKIQRLGCKVLNGRAYNEHNLPICAAPRENGSPCRRNVSRSACKWHGKVILLTDQNTKNGRLDANGNLLPPNSPQQTQRPLSPAANLINPVQNEGDLRVLPRRNAKNPEVQSRGLRWDNEEHFWFLLGYKKLGKKWSKISKIIKTRTALQTQSHAQKFFERAKNIDKKKYTIHDLSLESPEIRAIAARIPKRTQEARLAIACSDENTMSS